MWNVEAAIKGRAPARFSADFIRGACSFCIRSQKVPLLLSDLDLMTAPSLAAIGLEASVEAFGPDRPPAKVVTRRRRSCPVFVLKEPADCDGTAGPEQNQQERWEDPEISRLGLIAGEAARTAEVLWCEHGSHSAPEAPAEPIAGVCLVLRRMRVCGRRKSSIAAILLRWCAFAAAYPARVVEADEVDGLAACSRLMAEACAMRSCPVATRRRRALTAFERADVADAMFWIREACLIELKLPTLVRRPLVSHPDEGLSQIERRELIYLARAGSPELKTLALRRLNSEPERFRNDVSSTLWEMRQSENAWVRAAARAGEPG